MKEKLIKSIENKIIEHWYKNKNLKENNHFNNEYSYEDDVLIFCAPNIVKNNDNSIISTFIQILTSINSLLRSTKNKAHILFSEEQDEEFNFLNNLWNIIYGTKYKERIKLEIISKNKLQKISNFRKTQRAKRWGQLNNFANLTFYVLVKRLYKNILIFHNDVIFHEWSDKYIMKHQIEQNDLITLFGPIYFKEDETKIFKNLLNANISNWIKFDKKLFLKNHVHTGLLAASEKFSIVFKSFFEDNYERWIKEQGEYKYIEQEIIALFIHSSIFKDNNLKMKRVQKMEGKYSSEKKNLKMSSKYIHYDFAKKGLAFIKETSSYKELPYGLKILYNETKKIARLL